jgi:hypothetical protein
MARLLLSFSGSERVNHRDVLTATVLPTTQLKISHCRIRGNFTGEKRRIPRTGNFFKAACLNLKRKMSTLVSVTF